MGLNETATCPARPRQHGVGAFDNAVGMLLNTPKGAFVKQEKKLRKRREKNGPRSIRIDSARRNIHEGNVRNVVIN